MLIILFTLIYQNKTMNTKITFYPVLNGDCTLIEFANGQQMMFDCNFRSDSEDESKDDYDVIKDLLDNKLKRKHKGLPYLDAYVLTHPDQDHCRGFKDKFFQGKNPETTDGAPSKSDKDNKLIIIGELWYSPRVFSENSTDLSDDAKAFKKEAERRMKLYRNNSSDKDKPGNRIRIIGYADVDALNNIPSEVISAAGDTIKNLNGNTLSDSRFFVHAPFRESIENDNRNATSIVLQIRVDVGDKTDVGRIVLGGDSEWRVWKKILDKTSDDNNLKWNILEAPHHCSYHFFADERTYEPEQSSLDFLAKRVNKGYIVSSSKTIKQNDDTPPCQKAKNRYIKSLGDNEDYFKCTTVNDVQKPVVFEVKSDGIHHVEETEQTKETKAAIGGREHTYG